MIKNKVLGRAEVQDASAASAAAEARTGRQKFGLLGYHRPKAEYAEVTIVMTEDDELQTSGPLGIQLQTTSVIHVEAFREEVRCVTIRWQGTVLIRD